MAAKKWTLATVHLAEDWGGNILGVFETSALASHFMLEQKIAGKQVASPGMIEDGDERVFVNNVIFAFCKDKPWENEMAKREKLFDAAAAKRATLETSSEKLVVALDTIREATKRGEFYVDISNADAALQENLIQLGYGCVVKSSSAGVLLLGVNWR